MMPYRKSMSDFEDDGDEESDGGWQQELQRRYAQEANFMAELRARQQATSPPEMTANCNYGNYPAQSQQQGYHQPNYGYQDYNGGPAGGPGSRRSSDFSQHQFHINQGGPQHNAQNYVQNYGPFASQINERRNSKEFSEYANTSVDQIGNSDETDHKEGPTKETLDWEEALKNWVNR